MRYLTVDEVLALQKRIIDTSGGRPGLRYSAGLESAIAQPQVTFEGIDLYMTLASKASALAYSLIMNHPFSEQPVDDWLSLKVEETETRGGLMARQRKPVDPTGWDTDRGKEPMIFISEQRYVALLISS